MRGILKRLHSLMRVVTIALCVLGPLPTAAQERHVEEPPLARKLDEFGELRGCDAGARLDNFAVHLQNEPAAVGYIVAYGPEGEGFGTGRAVLGVMTNYLVNTRGISEKRFKTIYAGRYKEWKEVAAELWIVPPDAEAPEPLRFDTKVEPFTGMFEEFKAYDQNIYGESTGPPIYSTRRAQFADLLHEQTETRAVIVAYNMKGAAPGAWRRATKEIANDLQRDYKIEAERIETIYGGYREREEKKSEDWEPVADALVQLWVLPKGAPPPVAAVKEAEERPSEAKQLGSFAGFELMDEEGARRAFEGFADVLRSDEQMSACLIVRVEKEARDEGEVEEKSQAENAPPEPIDEMPATALMALIDKWRADLVKDYGISEHRLTVMSAEKDDFYELETWIVPRGAALPDPNHKEEPVIEPEEVGAGGETLTDEETQKEF